MRASLTFIILTATAAILHSQPIADSAADFSGIQGGNGWWYGYYDVSNDPIPGYDPTTDFQLCTYWDGSLWRATSYFVTSMDTYNAHPSGAVNTPGWQLGEQWAIRRWVSTVTDAVWIHGNATRLNLAGDGVTIKVLLNGRTLLTRSLDVTNGNTFNYSLGVQLQVNDCVDFVLTAGCCEDAADDSTQFTATIGHADFTVNVQPAVEVGVLTILDQQYQMQYSADLKTWQPIGDPFTGTGDRMYFLFSVRQLGTAGYFRAQALP